MLAPVLGRELAFRCTGKRYGALILLVLEMLDCSSYRLRGGFFLGHSQTPTQRPPDTQSSHIISSSVFHKWLAWLERRYALFIEQIALCRTDGGIFEVADRIFNLLDDERRARAIAAEFMVG